MSPAPAPNVRLALTNLPENVSLVREVLAGLAGAVPLGEGQLDDMKTVVSEACNNVVLHAYDGAIGPLDVEIRVVDGALEVAVRDSGRGIATRPVDATGLQGIGIPVIHALSDRAEFTGRVGEGTEVRMHFDVPGARALAPPGGDDPARPNGAPRDPPPTVLGAAGVSGPRGGVSAPDRVASATLVVAPLSLARSVLSRPLTALAARARFSIDRLSDLQLVTDAITAHAGRSLRGEHLQVVVVVATRDLELRVGPLRRGMAEQLIEDTAVAGLEPLLNALTDEITVERVGDSDVLTLRLLDPR